MMAKIGRPRTVPDDSVLFRRFAEGATTTELGAEYGVHESTMRYHRNRLAKAGNCWVCDIPMVGHSPSDHGEKS